MLKCLPYIAEGSDEKNMRKVEKKALTFSLQHDILSQLSQVSAAETKLRKRTAEKNKKSC